jgi:hypothetical protein
MLAFNKLNTFNSPAEDGIPGFAEMTPGEANEDQRDESDILTDQDQTRKMDLLTDDENMGAKSSSLDALEDEPDDFIQGEVDVKTQMDRAADALDSSIHGYESQGDEDSPRGDLGASFQSTPGGLEEVIQKTDQDLATHHQAHDTRDRDGRTGRHGHPTGAFTDIGAGRSGVTRTQDNKNDHR